MIFTTRFAPSPTGPLHLGHAYSACLAHDLARAAGGRFLLRIEDIDQSRARPQWENAIVDDLRWLGIHWSGPVMRQSDRLLEYRRALAGLWARGLLYACTCNRRDIRAALSAPQEGDGSPRVANGPDGPVYPGTCRNKPRPSAMPETGALRLDMAMARAAIRAPLRYIEEGQRPGSVDFSDADLRETIGDIVLARQGMGTSYHLSVVVDDAAQGVTHVIRGDDLSGATHVHVVLQHLLGLAVPRYHHHRLVRDETGKRLAKRDDARAISVYRAAGHSPAELREMVGLSPSGP